MARVKSMSIKQGEKINIDQYPNFSKSGSVAGMKKQYYGKEALLVKCGNYIYKVPKNIYNEAY